MPINFSQAASLIKDAAEKVNDSPHLSDFQKWPLNQNTNHKSAFAIAADVLFGENSQTQYTDFQRGEAFAILDWSGLLNNEEFKEETGYTSHMDICNFLFGDDNTRIDHFTGAARNTFKELQVVIGGENNANKYDSAVGLSDRFAKLGVDNDTIKNYLETFKENNRPNLNHSAASNLGGNPDFESKLGGINEMLGNLSEGLKNLTGEVQGGFANVWGTINNLRNPSSSVVNREDNVFYDRADAVGRGGGRIDGDFRTLNQTFEDLKQAAENPNALEGDQLGRRKSDAIYDAAAQKRTESARKLLEHDLKEKQERLKEINEEERRERKEGGEGFYSKVGMGLLVVAAIVAIGLAAAAAGPAGVTAMAKVICGSIIGVTAGSGLASLGYSHVNARSRRENYRDQRDEIKSAIRGIKDANQEEVTTLKSAGDNEKVKESAIEAKMPINKLLDRTVDGREAFTRMNDLSRHDAALYNSAYSTGFSMENMSPGISAAPAPMVASSAVNAAGNGR